MPPGIARLPKDKHGRPIPWFVLTDDNGTPDFRVIRRDGIEDAQRYQLCWVCGQHRSRFGAFVIGPMCAINRVAAEPPCHRDCAIYSARACPFLATPNMVRRERGLPEDRHVAGVMVPRNPGVALVWVTRSWTPTRVPGGELFELGDPTETLWYAHGRTATPAEIRHSVDTGLPILREAAETMDGPQGLVQLEQAIAAAQRFFPVDEPEPELSITCPKCHRTSHHPQDVEQGYCGACHDWTTPVGPEAP